MDATAAQEPETVTVAAIERIVELIAILAIAFLLLLDAPRLLGFLYREVVPDEAKARRVAAETSSAVGGYVAGVFAVAALAGVVSFLVMTLLGIPTRSRSRCRWRSSRSCRWSARRSARS